MSAIAIALIVFACVGIGALVRKPSSQQVASESSESRLARCREARDWASRHDVCPCSRFAHLLGKGFL